MKLSPIPTMSREEAVSIYNDLHHAMQNMMRNVGADLKREPRRMKMQNPYVQRSTTDNKVAVPSKEAEVERMTESLQATLSRLPLRRRSWQGSKNAVVIIAVISLGLIKAASGVLEYMVVTPAMASVGGSPDRDNREMIKLAGMRSASGISPQELDLLKSLDARRVQLEERRAILDAREAELLQKEQHVTVRIAELKDLTNRLQGERDKDTKKREAQLGQLANVYGAMAPADAAVLLDQLDIQTARSLVERMPEKRIGQLLPLMKPDRALMITQMLSGRGER